MRRLVCVLVAAVSTASASLAQVTDPNMTCADYLKQAAASGPTPKTGDADADRMVAETEGKMVSYCRANPSAKAMDAAMKAMGG